MRRSSFVQRLILDCLSFVLAEYNQSAGLHTILCGFQVDIFHKLSTRLHSCYSTVAHDFFSNSYRARCVLTSSWSWRSEVGCQSDVRSAAPRGDTNLYPGRPNWDYARTVGKCSWRFHSWNIGDKQATLLAKRSFSVEKDISMYLSNLYGPFETEQNGSSLVRFNRAKTNSVSSSKTALTH